MQAGTSFHVTQGSLPSQILINPASELHVQQLNDEEIQDAGDIARITEESIGGGNGDRNSISI